MSRTLQLLRDLIALPSVNPAFLPEGHACAGEARVAEYLEQAGRAVGLACERQEVYPGRENLILRLEPLGEVRQRVALAPHLDTVGGDVDGPMFTPSKAGDRLYGRGACDTKGSVASMFAAVEKIARRKARPRHTEISFVGLVDEENGQAGSRALAASGFRSDLAVAGEPTRLKVVTSHKGCVRLKIVTHGKAAHGSKPHLGRNAILEMARIVELMETTYRADLNTRRHALLGPGTVNVGSIRGGVQPNIVADRCSITVDRRTIPGEDDRTVRAELGALFKQHGLKAEISLLREVECLPLETSPKLPLVRHFMGVAGQRRAVGVDFFCDASPLAQGGIPGVAFGPGDIAQAHTPDEWISIESLDGATRLLTRFLESLP